MAKKPATSSLRESEYERAVALLDQWGECSTYPVPGEHTNYLLAEDDREPDRLDLLNVPFVLMLQGEPFCCPLRNPQLALDVGTGTGIWALDFAERFPGAAVIGTDVKPVRPSGTAEGCRFVVADADREWDFLEPEAALDLVHERYMWGARIDWPRFWRRAFEHLRPGGWAESQEFDAWIYSLDPGYAGTRMAYYMAQVDVAATRLGMSFRIAARQRENMVAAGFRSVEVKTFRIPIGGWDPERVELGKVMFLCTLQGLAPTALNVFRKGLGWDLQTIETLLDECRSELLQAKHRTYFTCYITYGQKPE